MHRRHHSHHPSASDIARPTHAGQRQKEQVTLRHGQIRVTLTSRSGQPTTGRSGLAREDPVAPAEERDGDAGVPALNLRRDRQAKRRSPKVRETLDYCLSRSTKPPMRFQNKGGKVLRQTPTARAITNGIARPLPPLPTLGRVAGPLRTVEDRRDRDHDVEVRGALATEALHQQVGLTWFV